MKVQRKTPLNEHGERCGEDSYEFTRENWREWFTFLIDPDYISANLPIPTGYFVARHLRFLNPDAHDSDDTSLGFECWVFPLSVFMWIFYKLI
jgi:hypothetical protein